MDPYLRKIDKLDVLDKYLEDPIASETEETENDDDDIDDDDLNKNGGGKKKKDFNPSKEINKRKSPEPTEEED